MSVATSYKGASAYIMESQVTDVLEESLSGIDGVDFLETIEDYEWSFVVRTSRKAHIVKDNEKVTLPTNLKEDECQSIIDCNFTQAHYGPVMILSWRKNQTTTIIYLVSNTVIQKYSNTVIQYANDAGIHYATYAVMH